LNRSFEKICLVSVFNLTPTIYPTQPSLDQLGKVPGFER
jgi:hypothetical protein